MDKMIIISIVSGIICAVLSLIIPIISLVLNLKYKHKKSLSVEEYLEEINSSHEGKNIAVSFLGLVSLFYVRIHVLINKGEKYSDDIQKKDYCESLTPKSIERINSVEGKYE